MRRSEVIAIAVAAPVMFGTLVWGPVACTESAQREATRRIEAACQGDLTKDIGRAIACALATSDAKRGAQR